MANSDVCATGAALRDVSNSPASAQQDCSDVIHISVFFDGTGNNKDADEQTKSWSNIARIWQSARMFANGNANSNTYPIYISGVGTPFNGKPLFPGDANDIAIEDNYLGGAAGAGGSRRLDYGQQQINDALRDVLLGNAKALGGKVAKYAAAGQQQSFGEVNKALGKHRLIKQINVSIFGFSRGAALARAFCNQWLWQCKEDRGKLSYEGYPIRFVFLGLFDTVASFGLPATNSANNLALGGFKGRDLVVDERVERCVHYVAAHELRFAFPVDLIRRDSKLAGNWLEKVYPGVHSDIGGGYQPTEQGIDNNYSRIPMRDMMRESLLVGTRLLGYDDLARNQAYKALFQERFECKPATEAAYKAYSAACNPGGSVERQVQKHMEQLYSAYGTLHRAGGESVTQREHRMGHSWSRVAPDDMAKELANYDKAIKDLLKAGDSGRSSVNPVTHMTNGAYIIRKGIYAMWIAPEAWQRDAWKKSANDGVMSFIHTYVHDSKVGFMSNAEPFSYFSKRGIGESSRSIQGWFEDRVARPVDKAYESTVDAASRGIEKGAEAAKKAQDAVVDKAQQARDAIAEKAQQAKEAITETATKVQRAATEVSTKVENAAGAAVNQGQQAVQSFGNTVGQATQDAVSGLQSAWQWVTH